MKAWQFFGVCAGVYVAPHIPAIAGVVMGGVCVAVMLATMIRGDE